MGQEDVFLAYDPTLGLKVFIAKIKNSSEIG